MSEPSEVALYVREVAATVEAVFGDRLCGVWLIGSHSYGGANEASDIDIQACVRDATSAEITDLADRIAHPRLLCPGAGLEFVLHDISELATPSVPLRWLLNLNGGPTREYKRSTDPTSESWHWFVLDLVVGRYFARTLAGSRLAEILGPIERHVQVEAIAESYRWHEANDNGAPNQIANAARSLLFLRTGLWRSKPDGLAWARSLNLRTPEVLEHLAQALRDEGLSVG